MRDDRIHVREAFADRTGPGQLRPTFVIAALLASLVLTLLPAPAQAATYTVRFSGVVVCDSSSWGVQGVWVENADGQDKFADWRAFTGKPNAARYSVSVSASRADPNIQLRIGCGGTTSAWTKTLDSPWFRTRDGRTDNRRCVGTATAANRADVCKPSPQPTSRTTNQGYAGYCTWHAYDRWKAWTGSYPDIGGNANEMDDNARAKGYYVSTVPHVGSMVVFNTSGYGHVGWVTKVYYDTTARVWKFDFTDMNGGSFISGTDGKTTDFNRVVTRTGRKWDPSIQAFIVAPS